MRVPDLTTPRLLIREFRMDDLDAIHRILDENHYQQPPALAERRQWLEWAVRNYAALASLYQFPYGDRAVTLSATGELIGAVGYAPVTAPLGQLPGYAHLVQPQQAHRMIPEVGLYYAIDRTQRGQGYATEAAKVLLDYAFGVLNLRRVVATTEYDNLASQAVMRRLGMRLERNPRLEPEWFQVVGILDPE